MTNAVAASEVLIIVDIKQEVKEEIVEEETEVNAVDGEVTSQVSDVLKELAVTTGEVEGGVILHDSDVLEPEIAESASSRGGKNKKRECNFQCNVCDYCSIDNHHHIRHKENMHSPFNCSVKLKLNNSPK